MGRWKHSTTLLGVLGLEINTKTGRPVGVSKSGNKRSARVWCERRQKQLHLGNFPDTPQAAVAIASAKVHGLEHIVTPKERKTRSDKKSRMQVAMPPARLASDC